MAQYLARTRPRRASILSFSSASAVIACTLAASLPCHAQARRSQIEVTLERKDAKGWKGVDPNLVLESGDVVRFRFKSNFDGYLYVTNHSSSGQYSLLFPREETGRQNLVKASREYMVPATEAQFRISGPAGYETIYWLVSPVVLGNPMPATPVHPSNLPPPRLQPRCDDTAMRARGLCLDMEAGPRVIGEADEVPENLRNAKAKSREMTIVQQQNQAVVSPSGPGSGPILYEFRLAHK